MKIMIVVGARPNFMKAAPILAAIQKHNAFETSSKSSNLSGNVDGVLQPILVHTGQHYDESMSGSFFADLNLPNPDVHLGVGSGSHASQTAEIMKRFEEVLLRERPEVLVVVGDVNSTLACALVAAKISFDSLGTRPVVAHVEAGLRSFDRSMPEEVNRILTDHSSDLLFVTERSGLDNLRNEGVPPNKIHFVGNTMIDSLLAFQERAEKSDILDKLGLRQDQGADHPRDSIVRYALLTLHRPSNVDNRESLLTILEGMNELVRTCPVIFPAHPRTQKRVPEFGLEQLFRSENGTREPANPEESAVPGKIRMINPLGYLDFLCLMKHAALVVTDSGGIQEETTCLGIPCVTVRENTERPVTIERGTNILAGIGQERIREAIRSQLTRKPHGEVPEKWDGKAAFRIVETLVREIRSERSRSGAAAGQQEKMVTKQRPGEL